MSRQNKESHGVQVFPFLAVLVCTMGALIFLLLVTTTQIRNRSTESISIPESDQSFADGSFPPPDPTPPRGFPEPAEKSDSQTIVIPLQPPQESKPIKVPDQSYALALAQREREISDLTTKWKLRTNILAKERKRYEAALKEHKALYAAAVERADSMKSDVSKMEGQLEQLDHEVAASNMDQKELAELHQIEVQIAAMKKRLRAAQAEEAEAGNEKFQVVPFDVQSGTTRRPIFIECTSTGIRFQPENIVITAADLEGFPQRINPLAAGTGALINYWAELNRRQRGLKPAAEPYILLMVRPDGVLAYYVALRMLEPIRTAHGYELVEDSLKLQYPEVDPDAKVACQRAVDQVLSQRESISRAAVAYGGAGSVFGGSLQGVGGGGSGNSFQGGPGSGSGPGSGKGGSGSRSSGNGFSVADVDGSRDVGNRSWERIENFEGRPYKRKSSDTGNASSNVVNGSSTNVVNGSRSGSSSSGSNVQTSGTSTNPRALGTSLAKGSTAGGSQPGSPGGAGANPGGTSQQPGSTPARSPNSKSMFGDDDDASEPIGPRSTMAGQPGSSASNGSPNQNGAPSVFGLNGTVPDDGSEGDSSTAAPTGGSFAKRGSKSGMAPGAVVQGNRQSAMDGGTGSPGDLRTSSSDGDGIGNANGTPPGGGSLFEDRPDPTMPIGDRPWKKQKNAPQNQASDGYSSDEASDADGATSGSATGSGSRSGSRGSGKRSLLSDTSGAGPRDPNGSRPSADSAPSRGKRSEDPTDRQLEPEMLAGRRWGLCEAGASIGLEREVRVDVYADKLLIAQQFEIPVGVETSKQESFELLATAIDRYSREWGRPPQGFFWTPRLRFVVRPEGYGQYESMNSMMVRAGLPTSHEIAKNQETAGFGKEQTGSAKTPAKSASKNNSGGIR